jgi:uncharacterized protein (TIGR00266 family)
VLCSFPPFVIIIPRPLGEDDLLGVETSRIGPKFVRLTIMQITTRHTPSFGVARLQLQPNENVRVEAGAMMAMSGGVQLNAKAEGGLFKSLKRAAVGGESFFVTNYTAGPQGGFVDVAARLPGDLTAFDVAPNNSWIIQKGSWLASADGVNTDARWGGFKNLFGSEGGFMIYASGQGQILVGCYGALESWDLQPGEGITIDTGHMVAYQESVTMNLRKVTGGLIQTFKSGEGVVFDFIGPGRVYTQTRNPNELLGWLSAAMPGASGGGSAAASPIGGLLGGLGGLMGGRE